ncbi:MAG: hypothetical protein A2174_02575 [Candidatus Portnoybacteria bacterium RBG_13_41_18]|uniref:Uncharacterized protein n=1 Tax=Candidatus Portnoybacteria bacterium RBG_13_41_18 TaxID=1801991 RepID=A0A1G2FAK3_9BACT|nr:MAG: hypothetical protein A2174_02575 [Candidatus Portnoybacteria bacterium RBG_13_41_18]
MELMMEERIGRTWIWFLTKSGFWRGLVLAVAVATLATWTLAMRIIPSPVFSKIMSHAIYLPVDHEVVKGLTNNQIEKDLSAYKQGEKGGQKTDFVKFSHTAYGEVVIDYWSVRANPTIWRHSQDRIQPVSVDVWHYIVPIDMKIADGKLVVERKAEISAVCILALAFFAAFGFAAGQGINLFLSKFLKQIYLKRLRP